MERLVTESTGKLELVKLGITREEKKFDWVCRWIIISYMQIKDK